MRFAILGPPADYPFDWSWAFDPQAGALREAGASVDAVPWTAADSLAGYDLVLPLVAWGYHKDYPHWLAQLDRWESEGVPMANPVPVLRWNSDKSYLAELAAKGVSTVPTLAFETMADKDLSVARTVFGSDQLVVKPMVSASAYGTYRLGPDDRLPEPVQGLRMLVQPLLEQIVSTGEYSLIFFDGVFSHSVSKLPAAGEFRVQAEHGGIIAPCDPPPGGIALGQAVLAASPAPTTYARVDLVDGNDGKLQLMELELTEPALFMAEAPQSRPRFAAAALSAARALAEQPLADRRG